MLDKILNSEYVLASVSPRRKYLLKQIGLNFITVNSNAEEILLEKEPLKSVRINAKRKSDAVAHKFKNKIIISADTVVVIDGIVLNKPSDEKEAKKFLKILSGKKHIVYTGINVANNITGREEYGYMKTTVEFRNLSIEEIEYYVTNHKPLDKAGAYGIQDDFGCLFIRKITGDYYNVVGLPLVKLYETITKTFI
ncbi:MAG: Maf family protein [Ignavibacteria bacterium]|nr:Maf family protein [Ignavibacteria bacterium]